MSEEKFENKNPKNNIGAIWRKKNARGDKYWLLKVTLDGNNHTLVAFPNSEADDNDTARVPMSYIFPFKPKGKSENYGE